MPNITAYLTIGTVDPTGDFAPSHWAYLVEEGRPTWWIALAPVHWVDLDASPIETKVKWLTTPTKVVEDAMVMVATVVEGLPAIIELVDKVTNADVGVVDLNRLPVGERGKLNGITCAAKHGVHIVATAVTSSVFLAHLDCLASYAIGIEVCTPSHAQDSSGKKLMIPPPWW